MSYIIDVKTSFPENYTTQEEIKTFLTKMWPEKKKYIDQFAQSSTVEGRHTALKVDDYEKLGDFGNRNNYWIETAFELQKKNVANLFKEYQLLPSDIGAIFSTTVTGLAIPTLESRLMNEFKINPRAKRIPLFGLGCLGGVAGINRVHDYLKSYPNEAVILLASELCTLTFQFQDQSVANLVGTSLFADGSAAVLMCGEKHPLAKKARLQVQDVGSFFYPETDRIMGWDVVSTGFQIILSGDVPQIVKDNVKPNLKEFLGNKKLSMNDVQFYISHPGGPKVLDAICEVTETDKSAFQFSYQSLKEKGNMSSVSVLDVMRRTFEHNQLRSGEMGVMIAMGPAFASEFNLIKVV